MEKKAKFDEISLVEKTIFKLSMITISTIVSNIFLVLILLFYSTSLILPTVWILINFLVILILGGILVEKMKLGYRNIIAVSLIVFFLFSILSPLLPIVIPENYIGLRQEDKTGYIIEDNYCRKDCAIVRKLIAKGYYEERRYFSWKYAELLGRYVHNDSCCYKVSFNYEYFYGILVLLELTFEYSPFIIIMTLLITIFEYYKRKDLTALSRDFISTNEFDIRKINLAGLSIIVIIVLYNIAYMNAF